MDIHVKSLYKELLDEAGLNKKIELNIENTQKKIVQYKQNLYNKQRMILFTKRRIDFFIY